MSELPVAAMSWYKDSASWSQLVVSFLEDTCGFSEDGCLLQTMRWPDPNIHITVSGYWVLFVCQRTGTSQGLKSEQNPHKTFFHIDSPLSIPLILTPPHTPLIHGMFSTDSPLHKHLPPHIPNTWYVQIWVNTILSQSGTTIIIHFLHNIRGPPRSD